MTKNRTEEIMEALKALGYKKIRELRIDNPSSELTNVYLNGEYFGVYDFRRGTFVD